jgi:biotin synthase
MDDRIPLQITICMGSSCFLRGNNGHTLDTIRHCVEKAGFEPHISGHLCENQCTCGPHITIEGTLYSNVQPSCFPELLKHHLVAGKEENDG